MSDWEKLRETYEVTDEGIIFVQSCGDNYARYSMVIPKRTFIEAYNKYIKEAADDRHSSSDS